MQNYWFDSFQKYLVSYLPSSLSLGAFSHHCYFLPDFPDWSPWCFLWLREVRSLHCCFQAQRFPNLNLTHRSQLDFINTQLISSKCLQWTTMNISYPQLNSSQFFWFGSDLAALMQILNGPRCPGSHCQSLRLLRYSPRLTRHVVQHLTLPARINVSSWPAWWCKHKGRDTIVHVMYGTTSTMDAEKLFATVCREWTRKRDGGRIM